MKGVLFYFWKYEHYLHCVSKDNLQNVNNYSSLIWVSQKANVVAGVGWFNEFGAIILVWKLYLVLVSYTWIVVCILHAEYAWDCKSQVSNVCIHWPYYMISWEDCNFLGQKSYNLGIKKIHHVGIDHYEKVSGGICSEVRIQLFMVV